MVIEEIKSLENALTELVRAKIANYTAALAQVEISPNAPEISVWSKDPQTYTSEIRIEFIKNGSLYDIIEFHLFRDGIPCLTLVEMERWIIETLQQIAEGKTPFEDLP